ncbi:MAG: hypothetical protein PHW10_05025 [Candidatus Peribacteraceae bacterium]|nr:hypothetical protein [Candidatus Peribacteraceae bacterium]
MKELLVHVWDALPPAEQGDPAALRQITSETLQHLRDAALAGVEIDEINDANGTLTLTVDEHPALMPNKVNEQTHLPQEEPQPVWPKDMQAAQTNFHVCIQWLMGNGIAFRHLPNDNGRTQNNDFTPSR